MSKFFIIIALMLTTFSTTVSAGEPEQVPLKKKPHPNGDNHNGNNRTLSDSIYIYQDEHELTFDSDFVGFTLTLVQNGETVYSNVVDSLCSMVIPDSLTGMMEIQLTKDEDTYWGYIIL